MRGKRGKEEVKESRGKKTEGKIKETGVKKHSTFVIVASVIIGFFVMLVVLFLVTRWLMLRGPPDMGIDSRCFNMEIKASSVVCIGTSTKICDVTLTRLGTETDEISGVKLVFRNWTAGTYSPVITFPGNIEPSASVTKTGINTNLSNVNRVEVNVYFNDPSGNDWLCTPMTNTYDF